jgi:lysophospholipase L1-like esterase
MHPHRTPTHRTGPSLRRWLAAAVSVAVAATTSLVATGSAGAQSGAGVLVVGDSLTVGATDYGGLRSKLEDAGFDATISARSGRGVQSGLSVLQGAGSLPGAVIVALGTNDVASGRSTKSFAALVDDVMETVGDDRLVLWVNLDLDGTTWGAAQAARFNRVLQEKSWTYGNLAVADWQSFANDHDSWLAADAVHLNGKGYRQRANFYLWQLQAWT